MVKGGEGFDDEDWVGFTLSLEQVEELRNLLSLECSSRFGGGSANSLKLVRKFGSQHKDVFCIGAWQDIILLGSTPSSSLLGRQLDVNRPAAYCKCCGGKFQDNIKGCWDHVASHLFKGESGETFPCGFCCGPTTFELSLIHISEPTRPY